MTASASDKPASGDPGRRAEGGRAGARVRRALRWATAILCGALLLALTGVTLVDVIGRYLVASPLPGASEYTELLVMAVVFAGLPAVCLDDGHVSVDLVAGALRGRLAALQLGLARLLVAGVLGLVAWRLWAHGAERLALYGETTIYLQAPLAPIAFAAAAICGVSAVVTLGLAVSGAPKAEGGGL